MVAIRLREIWQCGDLVVVAIRLLKIWFPTYQVSGDLVVVAIRLLKIWFPTYQVSGDPLSGHQRIRFPEIWWWSQSGFGRFGSGPSALALTRPFARARASSSIASTVVTARRKLWPRASAPSMKTPRRRWTRFLGRLLGNVALLSAVATGSRGRHRATSSLVNQEPLATVANRASSHSSPRGLVSSMGCRVWRAC